MPNNWKTYKLEKVATLQRGFDLPNTKRAEGNYPVIAASGFSTWHNEFKVKGPGVTTGRSGTLGQVHFVKDDFWPLNTSLWVKDFHGNDERFIYYFLKTLNFEEYNSGTSVPTLNRNDVHKLDVTIPDLQEQKSIASILSAIDDKIENNLAINKTLEEMAMALYKHWFVDFGPFQDGEFVESELGRIPKGWEVKQLEELVDIGSSKRIFYNEYVEAGIPFYRGKEVIELSKGKSISSELFITIEKFQEIKSKFEVPKKGDILISSVGTIGVSWLVDGFEDFYFKDGNLTWLKNYKTFLKGEYLHLWLNSENGKNQIDGEVIGSTQKALTISSLRNFKILFPSENVYKKIGDEFVNYYEQRQLNLIEIKTLTQLRDTLLPKLISGEVRLKEFVSSDK